MTTYTIECTPVIGNRSSRANLLIDGRIVAEIHANSHSSMVVKEACRIISNLYYGDRGLRGKDFQINYTHA